ncbi:MAG: hypothetical protein IT292_08890 [Deltaproteobacteria bacterium]|nr:hypothetical protein [Deltaproteobacteria bacterium]
MKSLLAIILAFSLVSLVSCASGARVQMPTELAAPQIPTIVVNAQAFEASYRPSVYLTAVKDIRTSPFLIKYDNRNGESFTGDLGLNVQYAFRKALRSIGFSVVDKASVALSPKIERWVATKKENEITCEAALALDLLGPDGTAINTSHYESFDRLHKDAAEDEILLGLGQVMSEVIKQAVEDKEIMELIKAY